MKKETKYVLACIGSNDALQQKCYEFLNDAKRDMEKILRMYILNFDDDIGITPNEIIKIAKDTGEWESDIHGPKVHLYISDTNIIQTEFAGKDGTYFSASIIAV